MTVSSRSVSSPSSFSHPGATASRSRRSASELTKGAKSKLGNHKERCQKPGDAARKGAKAKHFPDVFACPIPGRPNPFRPEPGRPAPVFPNRPNPITDPKPANPGAVGSVSLDSFTGGRPAVDPFDRSKLGF